MSPCCSVQKAGGARRSDGWRDQQLKMKQRLGLEDMPLWSSSKELLHVPDLARVRGLIDICYACHHKKHAAPGDASLIECNLIADISQSADRYPWSTHVRSICSGSSFYLFSEDRCLQARDHLQLLGWPMAVSVAGLTTTQTRSLTGESMGMPCIALASTCLMLTLHDPSLWEFGGSGERVTAYLACEQQCVERHACCQTTGESVNQKDATRASS
eukprot:6490616-Amphidinium_carterae.1